MCMITKNNFYAKIIIITKDFIKSKRVSVKNVAGNMNNHGIANREFFLCDVKAKPIVCVSTYCSISTA